MRPPSLAFALLAGGCFYKPGSYDIDTQPFAGKRVRLACLDVAVTLTDDAMAPPPVLSYTFGNHCTDATRVDLANVRVIARYADGTRLALHPHDPKDELSVLPIDGWWRGHEEIAYKPELGPKPAEVCVELGHVEPDPSAPDRWFCLAAAEQVGAP